MERQVEASTLLHPSFSILTLDKIEDFFQIRGGHMGELTSRQRMEQLRHFVPKLDSASALGPSEALVAAAGCGVRQVNLFAFF